MSDLRSRLASLSPAQRETLRRRLTTTATPQTPAEATPSSARDHPTGTPKFSLFFFAADDADASASYEFVLDCARFADAHGFHAVWLPERHFDPFGAPYPSPAVLAAAVAARTERIRVRAGSVVLPLHDPLLVAEQWSMVDNLAGGRVDLSLASGWHSQDFALSPDTYADRKAVLANRVAELRTLWSGGTVSRRDGNGVEVTLRSYPRPRQRELSLWLTSSSNVDTWRTAAELGANVLTALLEQSVEEVAEKVSVYRDTRAARGLDPDGGEVTLMVHSYVGADPTSVRALVRPPLERYLRSHIDLFEKLVRSRGMDINLSTVTEADKQMLAQVAFERYFTANGLFGTPQTATSRIEEFAAAGVTEVACLIDFGISHAEVLEGLRHLAQLKNAVSAT